MLSRWLKRAVLAVAIVALGGVLALAVEHQLPTELPVPTGSFAVGRTYASRGSDFKAWMWYPAATAAPADEYLPASVRTDWLNARPALINFLTRNLAKVHGHSVRDAAVAGEGRYPVVMLRGGGSSAALNYSSLAEDLASRGYVVVGLDLTPAANPELCVGRPDEEECATRLMTPLIDDLGRALDQLQRLDREDARFHDRLDLQRIGVFGHSFGGAQAAQFCSEDARCKAGIDIDGRLFGRVIATGIQVPFMFLLSDHSKEDDAVSRRILNQIQAIYDRQPANNRMRLTIRGAHHFTFSDDGALLKSGLFRVLLRVVAGLTIDGRRQIEVTAYAIRTFFDAYLRDRTPVSLALRDYPEIVVQP